MRKFLRFKEVERRIGFTRTTLARWEKQGTFPKRVQINEGCVGWFEDELDQWVESRERGTPSQREHLKAAQRQPFKAA